MLSLIWICQTFYLKVLSKMTLSIVCCIINRRQLNQCILDILNCIILGIQIIKYFPINVFILLEKTQILISNKAILLVIFSLDLIIKNLNHCAFHKYHVYHTIFIHIIKTSKGKRVWSSRILMFLD